MNEIASAAVQSIVNYPVKNAASAAGMITGATVEASTSPFAPYIGWVGDAAIIVGFLVPCALLYKAYIDIQIAKVQLAKEGRREADK
jgi:hypothetical protein